MKKIAIKAGLALSCGFTLFSCETIVRNQISKSVIKDIEEKNYPFPYHNFNTRGYEALIGNAVPMTKPYLNEELLNRIQAEINKKYSFPISAARKGILSDVEIVDYMYDIGILDEIKISKNVATALIDKQEAESYILSGNKQNKVSFSFDAPDKPVVYRAEFEPISSVLISFPIYYPLEWKTQAQLIKEVSESAQALVLVPNHYWQQGIVMYLKKLGIPLNNVKFIHLNTDDVWTRDYGPTTVFSGKKQKPVLLWNHYYQEYYPYQKADADAGISLGAALNLPVHRLPLIIEGGNMLTDGAGTMVMFSSAYYTNPEVDSVKLKRIVSDYFGCNKLVLFPPLKGELTGHIDMIVKFTSKDTVIVTKSKLDYKWYADFEKIANTLSKMTSSTGKRFTVLRIEMPETENSDETFYSYINSLIVNDKVVVPMFSNAKADKIAMATYKKIFPNKKVVGIYYDRYPVGSVHCQTKDIPVLKTDLRN